MNKYIYKQSLLTGSIDTQLNTQTAQHKEIFYSTLPVVHKCMRKHDRYAMMPALTAPKKHEQEDIKRWTQGSDYLSYTVCIRRRWSVSERVCITGSWWIVAKDTQIKQELCPYLEWTNTPLSLLAEGNNTATESQLNPVKIERNVSKWFIKCLLWALFFSS